MTQVHFISGLPRSGSTLLAAILRQNPAIHASMASPVGALFNGMLRNMSGHNEASLFIDDDMREDMLKGLFKTFYARAPEIVFDSNRMWPAKIHTLLDLFPEARFIACVREPAWVVDSIEKLLRTNAYEVSGIFGFEPGGNVFSRAAGLMQSPNGLVGGSLDNLREGYYSALAEGRMWLVEYEALVREPRVVISAIYDWLKIPRFIHDFNHVTQIPGAAEFDRRLHTTGLHTVGAKVEWRERETVLPAELFNSLPKPFWRVAPNPKVPVVHFDREDHERKLRCVS